MYGEGDAMVVDTDGYAKIVRHLATQTFVGGERNPRLLFRETVSEVHLSSADAECSTDCGVFVRTAEGHEYSAQYSIITFSVQYRIQIKFCDLYGVYTLEQYMNVFSSNCILFYSTSIYPPI